MASIRAAASLLQSPTALAQRAALDYVVYDRFEYLHRKWAVRTHLAMDGIFHEIGATVMEQEQRKGRAYEAFKKMFIADPKVDPSSIERMLHECTRYFY